MRRTGAPEEGASHWLGLFEQPNPSLTAVWSNVQATALKPSSLALAQDVLASSAVQRLWTNTAG